ncbi:hypothetical protein M9Y10_034644 [Tritrichomonas musculus]|uniref:DUF3447 domain-containing protein n=1 Tax=Tritrichomonas musculus TaxID=1915356 RepID=A0ABR2KFK0_9EUKA
METEDLLRLRVNELKKAQEIFLDYFEKDVQEEKIFDNIINFFEQNQITENKFKFKEILNLISRISDDHNRSNHFISKIERILKQYSKEIKKYCTNCELFHIFKRNKRILNFLFEEQIIIPDQIIYKLLITEKYRNKNYHLYFYPEFESFYKENDKIMKPELLNDDIEFFNYKRKIGENDNYICQLIQNDSIEDFVSYINRSNISINSTINPSIFETNLFLLRNDKPSLIEYAAFFGSIQIFKYLFINEARTNPNLWLYAIHNNNAELIHFLEEKKILPNNNFEQNYIESIKCHHINMMNYIKDNYCENEVNMFDKLIHNLHFYNFIEQCENDDIKYDNVVYYLCKYNHCFLIESKYHDISLLHVAIQKGNSSIVEILSSNNDNIDINDKIIFIF